MLASETLTFTTFCHKDHVIAFRPYIFAAGKCDVMWIEKWDNCHSRSS